MLALARNYFIIGTFCSCIVKVMFVSSVLKKCANLISHDSSKQNGSVSKEQAEVCQNKTPVNNKDLPSNVSADITGNKEEWKNHENQLIHNQKDVENIAPFHEDQNPLQIQDITANGTFSVENSFYLEESNITPLNITDISDNFMNALSFSDEKQENVSVCQDNYFGEVVHDDIKSFAAEFLPTSETIVFEDAISDGDSTYAKRSNDVNKTPENAGGSSVVMNSTFEFKDEQKTENSHYPENVSEVKPEQKLTDSKNDDIAYVETRAEAPDQNNTKNKTAKSRSQSQNGERCLETVKQEVSEIKVDSVAASENSIISPLKHQIQYENKPAGDVQSSPEECNLTFEHEFEQTVILHNENIQKEPIGDDINEPLGFEKKKSMSEQELEQNFMSVSNGVNDRDSSSHCDTELQTKQHKNESSSDNVGSFPSSTSCEINLAPELEQKDAIIYDDVAVVENNTSACDSKEQENINCEKRIDIGINIVSPEKNDICNDICTGELASEGTTAHQEIFSNNINHEKGDNVDAIAQYPSPVAEEDFKQEGNENYDNIENYSFMCGNKEQKNLNSEKQVNIVQEKTILNVVITGELPAEGAEKHQDDFASNINNEKVDNIDDIQPYSIPVVEENLAMEENISCNNVETNMLICDSKQQKNIDSENQADTVQEKSVLNVVLPEKNICNGVNITSELPVAKHTVHQEDSSNNAQNKKGDNVDDIQTYTTSVVGQDLAMEKNISCNNVETNMLICDSKQQKNVDSKKQADTVQEKSVLNVVLPEKYICNSVNITSELPVAKHIVHQEDSSNNAQNKKGDNVDDIQTSTTSVVGQDLAMEKNISCNNVETNMRICDSKQQKNVDSEKQADTVQEKSVLNVVLPEKNICNGVNITSELPVAKHIVHQEDSSNIAQNKKGDNVDDIQTYTTSVVGQDLAQEKNKICDNFENSTSISGSSEEQKNEDSGKQGEIVQDKTIFNGNPSSVSKGNGICNNINAVELFPEGNFADQDVLDIVNSEKGVEGDGCKEKSSCKPRNSVLLRFDPIYSQKSPNTAITEENCKSGSCNLEDVLLFSNQFGKANIVIDTTKLLNQELQESEAFFDAVMSDDTTNLIGKLLDISEIPPESKEETFIQEECNNSNPVFPLNEIAEVNTISGFEDSLNEAKIINSDTKGIGVTKADVSGKSAIQEEINTELKRQLSASQQSNAILELQLRQKENVILKNQEDALRKDEAYSQEIKQLKKKLEEQCVAKDNTEARELQEAIKSVRNRETKLISELNSLKNNEQNYRKIMDEYENTVGTQVEQLKRLSEEHETVKRHLANLELAFSDVHQKYERSKTIIDGYKCNEVALRQTLITSEESVIKSEQKYESLKSHAKAQIEKSNQAMHLMRQQSEAELHKLSAIIKRLEITNASLNDSLDQKKKECSALAALCDEVTGKV